MDSVCLQRCQTVVITKTNSLSFNFLLSTDEIIFPKFFCRLVVKKYVEATKQILRWKETASIEQHVELNRHCPLYGSRIAFRCGIQFSRNLAQS